MLNIKFKVLGNEHLLPAVTSMSAFRAIRNEWDVELWDI